MFLIKTRRGAETGLPDFKASNLVTVRRERSFQTVGTEKQECLPMSVIWSWVQRTGQLSISRDRLGWQGIGPSDRSRAGDKQVNCQHHGLSTRSGAADRFKVESSLTRVRSVLAVRVQCIK